MAQPTSTRPYLIRALYEWAVDNDLTPHLVVDATVTGVSVPSVYVQDGKITLNVHPRAVSGLELGNEWIVCSARFGGQSYSLTVPVLAVRAVYARETGQGMAFPAEPDGGPDNAGPPDVPTDPTPRKGPALKIVK